MLSDTTIRSTITSLERDYKGYKDGGREFLSSLCNKINRLDEKEKEEILSFFLREIEKNEDSMTYIAIAAIRFLKATNIVTSLKEISNTNSKNKDETWKNEVRDLIIDLEK